MGTLINCKIYIQILGAVYLLVSFSSWAKNDSAGRAPCNFVPDDDVIVVPMVIEKNFIDEFHDKHQAEFHSAKKTLRYWISQEQYAIDYGLENTGIVTLPTTEEKERFLQKHYLRFLSKDVEKSTNRGLENKWKEWTADDEIDAINSLELHEKVIVKAKNSKGQVDLKATKSVQVGEKNWKFGFHPRVEIGMVKFTMESEYLKGRAWLGINGNQEIKLERKFVSTKSSAFMNYYVDEAKVLAAFDQRLTSHWIFRMTHSKDFDYEEDLDESTHPEDNVFQFRFNIRF